MTDPGLQPERTRLAWRRTVLAVTGVALLAGRLALVGDGSAVVVALAALLWVFALVVTQRRVRSLARAERAGWASGAAITAAVCGFAILGLVMILSGVR